MAKDRRKVQHIHSSVPDKQPTPASLEVGEIAVNNSKNQEFLSIKNSEDKVVRFSSDEQVITIMERKEVMPYEGLVRGAEGPGGSKDSYNSYGITEGDLKTNKSNLIIKLNQVAAGNTTKHDKVNGAKDIYNNLVNPTTDGGLNDGAGFAIDMSRYAMNGANPSFSSMTTTCHTELNGRTEILGGNGTTGDCRSYLKIDVLTADTKVTSAKTDIVSATTIIGKNDTTISGDTTLKVSGTTTDVHQGNVTITNNSGKTENVKQNHNTNVTGNTTVTTTGNTTITTSGTTNINSAGKTTVKSCSGVEINTNDFKVKQCSGTNGSAEMEFCGGYNIKSNNVEINQCSDNGKFTINEETVTVNAGDTTINDSGNTTVMTSGNTAIHSNGAVGITAKGDITAISSESDIFITANKNLCATAGDNATIYGEDVTNVGTNCNGAGASTNTNISGGTIGISASTLNEKVTGNETVNIGGNYITNVTGNTQMFSTGKTCINSTGNLNIGSDANTNIGINCNDGVYSNNVNISATSSINESATTVNVKGSSTINIEAPTTNVTGNTTLNLKGNTVNVSANTYSSYTTSKTCILANTDLNMGGNTNTRIGTDCNGSVYSDNTYIYGSSSAYTYAPNIYVSGNTETHNVTNECITASNTLNMGGDVNTNIGSNCAGNPISNITNIYGDKIINSANTYNVTATTINNSATTINNTATTYNVTATTHFNGDVYIDNSKKLYLTPDCTSELSSTTVNAALCEVMDRSEVTFKVGDYAATDENLKWYELWQNGKQLKDQNGNTVRIDIPKDHILKDVSIVNGHASGSSFTACTAGDKTCEWYIKLVWNVFNPTTGHSNDKTVYLPANNLVQDHSFDDTSAINFTTDYDGQKIHVSADTTVQIVTPNGTSAFTKSNAVHSLNSYKLNVTHNGLVNAEFDPFKESTALTLPHSALTLTYGATSGESGSVTFDTSASGSVNIPTCVNHLNRNKLTFSAGTFTASTYDPGQDCTNNNESIAIPASLSHLTDWSNNCLSVNNNLCVSGTVTSTGGMYTSSDKALKDDIHYIRGEEISRASKVELKSFYYKSDPSRRKVYGVIAQDVEHLGLEELVHYDENGMRSVDYTGLLLLKIAALEKEISILKNKFDEQK